MNTEGWIKLHRKIWDNPLWKCEPFTRGQAWVDLILLANHSDNEIILGNQIIECKRGQVVMSLGTYSKRWKWGVKKVRLFFELLLKTGQIGHDNVQKTTRITICNYETYQGEGQDKGTMKGKIRARSGHDQGNKQECKECKECKE